MKHKCKHPQRCGKHVQAVLAELSDIGATDVVVRQNGHVQVSWVLKGRPMRIALPIARKCSENALTTTRQMIRRTQREARPA